MLAIMNIRTAIEFMEMFIDQLRNKHKVFLLSYAQSRTNMVIYYQWMKIFLSCINKIKTSKCKKNPFMGKRYSGFSKK